VDNLDQKRIDWLFEQQQVIGRAQARFLRSIGLFSTVAWSLWLFSNGDIVHIQIVGVDLPRLLVLLSIPLVGWALVSGFMGSLDVARENRERLKSAYSEAGGEWNFRWYDLD